MASRSLSPTLLRQEALDHKNPLKWERRGPLSPSRSHRFTIGGLISYKSFFLFLVEVEVEVEVDQGQNLPELCHFGAKNHVLIQQKVAQTVAVGVAVVVVVELLPNLIAHFLKNTWKHEMEQLSNHLNQSLDREVAQGVAHKAEAEVHIESTT